MGAPRGALMSFSDLVEKWRPWMERYARTAYAPVVDEGHGADAGSRFNGSPFLVAGEEWPACQVCKKPMPLFLQLDLDDLPREYAGRFGSGLLQLFYCVDKCEYESSEAWAPFDHTTKLVRIVAKEAGAIAAPRDVGLKARPQAIIGWTASRECCNYEEADQHGIKSEYKREGLAHRIRYLCEAMNIDSGWLDEGGQDAMYEKVFNPANRDKLGGWPYWVQGVEYPNCTECGTRMELVFQIDSEDHVPFMFGDVGCGHITQCPTHKHIVTFGWACC